MNRGGFINLTYIFVIIIVIVALAMAQNGFKAQGQENMIKALNWSNVSIGVHSSLQNSINNAPQEWVAVLLSIIEKAIDFFGYSVFELGKLATNLAFENPDIINYKVLFGLLILSLFAPLIYPAFIIIISLILIVKEWFVVRKENKALKKLGEGHGKSLER